MGLRWFEHCLQVCWVILSRQGLANGHALVMDAF